MTNPSLHQTDTTVVAEQTLSLSPPSAPPTLPHRTLQPNAIRRLLLDMLPLILLSLLVLATSWLVRSMPEETLQRPTVSASVPSAYMQQFQAQHFGAQGELLASLSGEQAHHLPANDSIHIQHVQGYYINPDNGTTLRARADSAVALRSNQQVDLNGHVHLIRTDSTRLNRQHGSGSDTVQFDGNHLRISQHPERISTSQPVRITQRGNTVQGSGLDYRHDRQVLHMQGRVRATLQPH